MNLKQKINEEIDIDSEFASKNHDYYWIYDEKWTFLSHNLNAHVPNKYFGKPVTKLLADYAEHSFEDIERHIDVALKNVMSTIVQHNDHLIETLRYLDDYQKDHLVRSFYKAFWLYGNEDRYQYDLNQLCKNHEKFTQNLFNTLNEKFIRDITQKYQPTTPECVDLVVSNFVDDALILIDDFMAQLKDCEKTLHDAKNQPKEAPSDAPLGDFAFSEDRKDTPYEKNTEEEDSLQNALMSHFQGTSNLSAMNANELQKFVNSGWYDQILRFPDEQYDFVYRGMSVAPELLADWLGVLVNEIIEDNPRDTREVDLVFKPRVATSSWTTSQEQARQFGNESKRDDQFVVILRAPTRGSGNQFLLNPEVIYNIRQIDEFETEQETIAVGPVFVDMICWSDSLIRVSH